MKCDVINDPATGQPMGFVCTGRGRTKYCPEPGCGRRADLLCDFPLRNGKTCDRPICLSHATHLAKDTDWCAPHQRWWRGLAALIGAPAGGFQP
jgi:hypothetical protein